MKKKSSPTDSELSILQVLWRMGPCTVRQVYEELGAKGAYTTVLTIMKIMSQKGLIKADRSQTAFVYSVTAPAATVRGRLVANLIERAFGGAAQELILQALAGTAASEEDLKKMRQLLTKLERKAHE